MEAKLTLFERLYDLRKSRGLRLADVAECTGISKSTLQRLEYNSPDLRDEPINAGYQEIVKLAKFYDVSTDYLLGFSENLKHRNVEIDKLQLSDSAIEMLTSGKANNRLLSEFITHEDFPDLLMPVLSATSASLKPLDLRKSYNRSNNVNFASILSPPLF